MRTPLPGPYCRAGYYDAHVLIIEHSVPRSFQERMQARDFVGRENLGEPAAQRIGFTESASIGMVALAEQWAEHVRGYGVAGGHFIAPRASR